MMSPARFDHNGCRTERGHYVLAKDYYNDTEALKKKQARTGVECRAEMNEAYGEQVKALQQRNAELEAKNAELELWQNKRVGEIKALGIKEACQYFKENSWDFGNHTVSVRDLKDYATNLKGEEV